MALPTTISGTIFTHLCDTPPILYGGNVYVVLRDITTAGLLRVFKATDPTSSFTEQDGSNRFNVTGLSNNLFSNWGIHVVGSDIHISAYTTDSGRTISGHRYARFSMSSDTWAVGGSGEDVSGTFDQTGTEYSRIRVRGDGSRIVVGTDNDVTVHGTKYTRVSYWKYSGGSWGSAVAVDDGGTVHYTGSHGLAIDDGNKIHIVYRNSSDSHLYHKSLSSADSLSSAEAISDNTTATTGPSDAKFYDSSGTKRVTVVWKRSSNNFAYTSEIDNDGTPGAEEQASDNTVYTTSEFSPRLAVDGTTVYLLYMRASDQDMYSDSNANSAGWGTDTNEKTLTGTHIAGAAVYTRSGSKVIAVLYATATAIQYDEISLGSAPQTVNPTPAAITFATPVPAVTGGAKSLSPSAAAITFVTPTPTLTRNRTLLPDSTAIVFATQAPVVTGGASSVSPDAAVLVFATPIPTLSGGAISLSPDPAAMVFATANPTVTGGTATISPTAAAIVFATVAPTVSGGAVTLSPTPGVITFATPVPTITNGYTLFPDAVAITFVTAAPTVSGGAASVSPTPASIVFATVAPSVTGGTATLLPTPTQIIFATQAPTLTTSRTLSPDAAQIVFVAPAPSVAGGAISLAPDPGVMAFVATQPSVTGGAVSLSPAPGVILFLTPAASVAGGARTVSPDPAALVWLTPVPTIIGATQIASPTPVTMAFVVPAPAVTGGVVSLSPDPAVLAWAVTTPVVTNTAPTPAGASYRFIAEALKYWLQPWYTPGWWREIG